MWTRRASECGFQAWSLCIRMWRASRRRRPSTVSQSRTHRVSLSPRSGQARYCESTRMRHPQHDEVGQRLEALACRLPPRAAAHVDDRRVAAAAAQPLDARGQSRFLRCLDSTKHVSRHVVFFFGGEITNALNESTEVFPRTLITKLVFKSQALLAELPTSTSIPHLTVAGARRELLRCAVPAGALPSGTPY